MLELRSLEWEMFFHIPKQAYVDPKWKGTTPYQVLREVGRGKAIIFTDEGSAMNVLTGLSYRKPGSESNIDALLQSYRIVV